MKKILAIALCICMVFAICACGNKESENNIVGPGGTNPMTAYDSLEAINTEVGCKLAKPGVMGVTDEAFFTYDVEPVMAEYQFTVGGYKYNFRSSAVGPETDISGLHDGEGTVFQDNTDAEAYYFGDEYKAARWFTIDGQYVLTVSDNGKMEEDTFRSIAEELKSLTATGMSDAEKSEIYDSLVGSYEDSFSQRAVAEVTRTEDGVQIVVNWGSSASEMTCWTMQAYVSEDGLISYPEEQVDEIKFASDGTSSTSTTFNDAGCFSFDGEELAWTGAADESCRDCVFVKLPE